MGKRSREQSLPEEIDLQPLEGDPSGNFAVYFPSGFNPNDTKAECDWETYGNADKKRHLSIVAKTAQNVDFIGTTPSAEYTSALPCKYALGVFDKKTGTLEVATLPPGRVMRMEPRAKTLTYTVTTAIKDDDKGDSAIALATLEERRALNQRLVAEFGSQRRRRQLAAAKAAQVDANQVSAGKHILSHIASQNPDAESKEAVMARTLAQRNIPPHHLTATTAHTAYKLQEVIPSSVWDALEIRKLFPAVNKPEYLQELLKTGTFGKGYVLSRMSALSSATTKEQREDRARCLVMVGHLLKLYTNKAGVLKVGSKGVTDVASAQKMETSVLEGLLELFYSRESGYDGDKYLLSKEKKDLMLSYILVLVMLAENETTLDPSGYLMLADELKMRVGDLVNRFREVGCTDVGLTLDNGDGSKSRSYKVVLMPVAGVVEEKTLASYLPGIKLGGKKPGGR